jgi:hypothetical protein
VLFLTKMSLRLILYLGKKMAKRRIRIKKSKQGSLRRATKTKKGQKIPVSELRRVKKLGTPAQRKKANFALNARKWKNS